MLAGPPQDGSVRIAGAACFVALAAFALGCRRDKAPVRVHVTPGESTVLPRMVHSPWSPETTRTSSHTIVVAGKERRYTFVEPTVDAPAESAKRYPLVLVFHGDGGSATSFHQAWPFERATGKDAFIAYLDGLRSTWDLETTKDNPDVAFTEGLIAELEKHYPIDSSRIFAAGYSSGGFFSNVLACQRPDLLRAIASNAGGAPYNQREAWTNGYPKCPGQKPVSVLALHGQRDTGVTLDSGRFSAQYWAYVDGCTTDEMETTGYTECNAYRGCNPGKAVVFCSIPALGHWVWSEAADAAWTFFERH